MKWTKGATVMAGLMAMSMTASAQQNFDNIEIKTQKLNDTIYVLFGAGGNIGVSVGENGVFIIDDQYAPLTSKIRAAIRELSDQPIRFAINTHFHGDHTGGNENLGKTGTVIVAHDNVHVRMSEGSFIKAFNSKTPPQTGPALPVVTFNDKASLHLNGENARMHHVTNAHTDGDTIVHFEGSNIIHMGDTFFNGLFPFIDVGSGGSIDGVIGAAETALTLADGDTQIIPGHGPVTDREGLENYLAMLKESRARIADLRAKGLSLEDIQAAKPLADYAETIVGGGENWDNSFVEFVYSSIPE
jgi:glyoxylase-like metal-dependent hydrolase (beta-lactamase superfamily II)